MAPGSVVTYVDREGKPHNAMVLYFYKEKQTGVNIRRVCVDIIYGKRITEKSVPFYQDGMKGHFVLTPEMTVVEQEAPPPGEPETINTDTPIDTFVDGLPDLGDDLAVESGDDEPINMDTEDQPSLGESKTADEAQESNIDGLGPLQKGTQETLE